MRNEKGQFVKGGQLKDLKGMKFNMFTVLEFSHVVDNGKNRRTYWKAKCDCGTVKTIRADQLKTTKSCGCHKTEVDKEKAKKLKISNRKYSESKPLSRHGLYTKWKGMVSRCYDNKDARFSNYGARGIYVCCEWLNDFRCFYDWGIQNGYKDGLEIDRINNDDGYTPYNCRFVTRKENCNNRSTTIKICYNGNRLSIQQWSELLNVDNKKIRHLLNKGNSMKEIIDKLQVNTEVIL